MQPADGNITGFHLKTGEIWEIPKNSALYQVCEAMQ